MTPEGDFGPAFTADPGLIVDAEIVDEPESRSSLITGYERPDTEDDTARTGPPKIDEWLDFFSRIVLRILSDWYISFAFRGVDEDLLSERDLERIKLSKEERKQIAIPFAEFANKSKTARKHGRVVVAAADSIDSFYILTIWAARVNRVARKYRPKQQRPAHQRGAANVRSRQAPANGSGTSEPGTFTIINPGSS